MEVKKLVAAIFLISTVLSLALVAVYDMVKPRTYQPLILGQQQKGCVNIQSGLIKDSAGNPLSLGYDQFGYNYQAHTFNGRYCDYDRELGGENCDVELNIKWSEGWLSNNDCDGDGRLDKHYGFASYQGSGGWMTNHYSGGYDQEDKKCSWNYFSKIVAVPTDAYYQDGAWYTSAGIKIGPEIEAGESVALVEQIVNDPCGDYVGKDILSPVGPGLGKFK